MRDYLIYAIEDNPSMLEHMQQLFDWKAFRDIVNDTMTRVRNYINFSCLLPAAPFLNAMAVDSPRESAQLMYADLNSIVNPAHDRFLSVCYKRMNGSVVSMLASMRKKIPMIKPPVVLVETDSDSESESDTEEDVVDKVMDKLVEPVIDKKDKEKYAVEDFKSFISESQYNVLKHIMLRLSIFKSEMLFRSISFFPFFGVPESTLMMLREIVCMLQEGSISAKHKLVKMREIQAVDRHAYNLLHIASGIVREISSFTYLRVLPYHYWKYQIEAIQERYGLDTSEGKNILDSTVYMYFCKVCDKVYSLIRDFKSVYRNEYTFGYRDADVDFDTMDIYCKRDKCNHRGKCGETPLSKIPILGHLFYNDGKTVMLCPQKRCGLLMVLDPEQSAYNERGPACSECTGKLRIRSVRAFVAPTHEQRCVKCVVPLPRPQNVFLYPHGVVLCRHHNMRGIAQCVKQKKPKTSEETHAVIVKFIADRKAERHTASLPMLAKNLARAKQSARANVRR